MARIKIDYGIDLGTTNSAISRMERGEATIIKTDTLKDTMPSCVFFNRKKVTQVGDSAVNNLSRDALAAFNKGSMEANGFLEFKRTMGTDKKYFSPNLERELSSEELSAEVLKTLRSFVTDEEVPSAVITVPAAFKVNQIDATRRAAKLAGFSYSEVLQEPVAAALAYGLETSNNGYWLVFDFGGGTFDTALLHVVDGIIKVIDTEGDSYLGGKNLDLAILEDTILPAIDENHKIASYYNDDAKLQALKNILKVHAERAKISLSFNEQHNILTDLGDLPEDDDGDEMELDITLTQQDMKRLLSPIFQKAIDLTKDLLNRNNITADKLTSIVLVGGPTYSPVLREMLSSQLIKPDTSIDPMTVVSRGAALYASTIAVRDDIREQVRDKTKIQLDIGHETTSVETEEFVAIKILADKTEGVLPAVVFAEITRGDKGWSSGRVEINTIGELVEVALKERASNSFDITLYDGQGNVQKCEPSSFTIIQGTKIGSSTLPYSIGVEIRSFDNNKVVFKSVAGLEKNKSLPAIGTTTGLKTQKQIRPGIAADFIKVPLYQGEHGAEGTRAIYNEHVYDIIISGDDLPALLPENSEIDLTVKVDQSQKIVVEAYFPHLDHTEEIEVPTGTVQSVDTVWLEGEIAKTKKAVDELKGELGAASSEVEQLDNEVREIERRFEGNLNDIDTKMEVLTNLRKTLKKVDELSSAGEWPKIERELKKAFYDLEKANSELGNDQSTNHVNQLRTQVDEVVRKQDSKLASKLLEDIESLFFELTMIYQLINYIRYVDEEFSSISWKDKQKARQLVNEGLQIINSDPSVTSLRPIIGELANLMPRDEQTQFDDSLLIG